LHIRRNNTIISSFWLLIIRFLEKKWRNLEDRGGAEFRPYFSTFLIYKPSFFRSCFLYFLIIFLSIVKSSIKRLLFFKWFFVFISFCDKKIFSYKKRKPQQYFWQCNWIIFEYCWFSIFSFHNQLIAFLPWALIQIWFNFQFAF
jgi:hypothetical protein